MVNWENGVTPLNETNLNATNTEIAKRYNLERGETTIEENTDLNTLTNIGTYRCISKARAETLTNCPYQGMFKMIVEKLTTTDTVTLRQTILTASRTSKMYIRTNDANGWGKWGIHEACNIISTGALTYNTTYVVGTPDVNLYAKNGNVVQLSFRAKLADSIPNNTTLITLPYKSAIASVATAFKGYQYNPTAPHFAYTSSNSDYIKINTWSETDKYIHIALTYITNED